MKFLHFGLLVSAVVVSIAGCSSAPVQPPPAAAPTVAAAPVSTSSPSSQPVAAGNPGMPQRVVQASVATVSLPPHLDPSNPIASERSVYFDFDNFTLKSEYTGVLDRHGKYLASRPSLAIKVEGNADERGSAEYNLSLGQKRAEVVLRALKVYGVKDSQVEAVSWGEERPKANGQGETAWAQNRRADLTYPRQ
jgi:peptidoglycan-associated lipoprotein